MLITALFGPLFNLRGCNITPTSSVSTQETRIGAMVSRADLEQHRKDMPRTMDQRDKCIKRLELNGVLCCMADVTPMPSLQ